MSIFLISDKQKDKQYHRGAFMTERSKTNCLVLDVHHLLLLSPKYMTCLPFFIVFHNSELCRTILPYSKTSLQNFLYKMKYNCWLQLFTFCTTDYFYRVSIRKRFFVAASYRDWIYSNTDDLWLILFPDMGDFVPNRNFDPKSIQSSTKSSTSQMSKSGRFQNLHDFP